MADEILKSPISKSARLHYACLTGMEVKTDMERLLQEALKESAETMDHLWDLVKTNAETIHTLANAQLEISNVPEAGRGPVMELVDVLIHIVRKQLEARGVPLTLIPEDFGTDEPMDLRIHLCRSSDPLPHGAEGAVPLEN